MGQLLSGLSLRGNEVVVPDPGFDIESESSLAEYLGICITELIHL